MSINVSQVVEILKLIISIMPTLIQLIQQIEAQFPDKGLGSQKLQLVHDLLISVNPDLETSWSSIAKVVNSTVAFFNSTGKFKS